ncbi:SUMF1/EgtB/PvdO family nonheme iron enzyme [Endothiovibrio diazotrophicus]
MSQLFVSDGRQIVGQRENQEDAFLIVPLEGNEERAERVLVILADGMGGHAAGQVASEIVVNRFRDFFTQPGLLGPPSQLLGEALDFANRAVGESAASNPAYHGMGCTVVAVLCENQRAWWVSVGDSHLYLLRDNRVSKLNADHSYGGYLDTLEAKGENPANAQNLPRNMLMSAVVGERIPMVDLPSEPLPLKTRDRLVLASDGLDTIAREELALRFDAGIPPGAFAQRLVETVEQAGKPRQDNTTVAVIEVRGAATVQRNANGTTVPTPPANERRRLPLLAGGLVLLAVAAGGSYYFIAKSTPPPPPTAEAAVATGDPLSPQPTREARKPLVEAELRAPLPKEIREFRDTLRDGAEGPEMVEIVAGHFVMGRPQDPRAKDEYPPHSVTVPGFAMGRYELTVAEYRRFAEATDRAVNEIWDSDPQNTPITGISWGDALAYTDWLSEQTGHHYRLPSEAEWEYAAGAATTTHYWWGYRAEKGFARCFDCGEQLGPVSPLPIGSFQPNPYGVYDTSGNVAEWVRDCYHPNYNNAPRDGSAWEEEGCDQRIARGGSYANASSALRTAARAHFSPDTTLEDIGFRVARDFP